MTTPTPTPREPKPHPHPSIKESDPHKKEYHETDREALDPHRKDDVKPSR
jgi:hypothetical protein